MSTMLALEFASSGDYTQLEVLLRLKERSFNINFQDNDFDGKAAIHWTAMKAQTFVENVTKNDILIRDNLLHSAVWEGNIHRLLQLLAFDMYKKSIDEKDLDFADRTSLHISCQQGFQRCSEILLENGADPNIRMHQGWTPAHCAAENGHLKILHLLGKYGGTLIAKDDYGATPKNIAEMYGHTECVELLSKIEENPSFRKDLVKENFLSAARRTLKSKNKVQ